MKKLLAPIVIAMSLAACGGGGGGGSDTNPNLGAKHTYINQGGLIWSETLVGVYPYEDPQGYMSDTASYQCSGSSSTNGGPQVMDNFNGEKGWSIPTLAQFDNFYKYNPKPASWGTGKIWAQGTGNIKLVDGKIVVSMFSTINQIDSTTGKHSSLQYTENTKIGAYLAMVVCVKEVK